MISALLHHRHTRSCAVGALYHFRQLFDMISVHKNVIESEITSKLYACWKVKNQDLNDEHFVHVL